MTELMPVEALTALDLSNSAHLQSKHFPEGVSAVLTIRGFRKELCKSDTDQEEVMRNCMVFVEIDKTLVLNETKLGMLTKLFGRVVLDWIGKRVRLEGGETLMKGKLTGCINIKPVEAIPTQAATSRPQQTVMPHAALPNAPQPTVFQAAAGPAAAMSSAAMSPAMMQQFQQFMAMQAAQGGAAGNPQLVAPNGQPPHDEIPY